MAHVEAQAVTTAQPDSPRTRGPLVWLGMDQWELDDAYDHTRYAPNRENVLARYLVNSEAARVSLGAPERIAYGPTDAERLDLFRASGSKGRYANGAGSPVQIT